MAAHLVVTVLKGDVDSRREKRHSPRSSRSVRLASSERSGDGGVGGGALRSESGGVRSERVTERREEGRRRGVRGQSAWLAVHVSRCPLSAVAAYKERPYHTGPITIVSLRVGGVGAGVHDVESCRKS